MKVICSGVCVKLAKIQLKSILKLRLNIKIKFKFKIYERKSIII